MNYVLFFLLFGFCDFVIGSENQFSLEPFVNSSVIQAMKEIGCLPVRMEVSKEEIEEIYAEFRENEDLEQFCERTKGWGEMFALSHEGALWKNYRFGVFNNTGPTHKKRRLIEGINCKISREFYDWIKRFQGDALDSMSKLDRLFNRLLALEELCHSIFMDKIKEIAQEYPEVEKIMYEYEGRLRVPITIRLIRFDKTGRFCLPFHYDVSIMTLIFPSDDDPLEECLIIAPARGQSFNISEFRRPIRAQWGAYNATCGLLISGTLLSYLGIPIPPTPHGVLPHDRNFRYVITACCHIPYLNTSHMDSVITDNSEIPKQFLQIK